jgi:hypothetical protein
MLVELSSSPDLPCFIDRVALFGESQLPVDAWGRPIEVRIDAAKTVVEVSSRGADGVDNEGLYDDIIVVRSNSVRCNQGRGPDGSDR